MEPLTATILVGISNVIIMGGTWALGYMLGEYCFQNRYNDSQYIYPIRPMYNNIHNMYKK